MLAGIDFTVCVCVCVCVCVSVQRMLSWIHVGFTSRVFTAQPGYLDFHFMLMRSILHVFVFNLTLSCPYRYIYSIVLKCD